MIWLPKKVKENECEIILNANPFVQCEITFTHQTVYTHYVRHVIKDGRIQQIRKADLISFTSISDIQNTKYLISDSYKEAFDFSTNYLDKERKSNDTSAIDFFKKNRAKYILVSLPSFINYFKGGSHRHILDNLDFDELHKLKFDIFAHIETKK